MQQKYRCHRHIKLQLSSDTHIYLLHTEKRGIFLPFLFYMAFATSPFTSSLSYLGLFKPPGSHKQSRHEQECTFVIGNGKWPIVFPIFGIRNGNFLKKSIQLGTTQLNTRKLNEQKNQINYIRHRTLHPSKSWERVLQFRAVFQRFSVCL